MKSRSKRVDDGCVAKVSGVGAFRWEFIWASDI